MAVARVAAATVEAGVEATAKVAVTATAGVEVEVTARVAVTATAGVDVEDNYSW